MKTVGNRGLALPLLCIASGLLSGCADGGADEEALARGGHVQLLSVADCPQGYRVILGTPLADVLRGTSGRDCILGLDGDDTLLGFGGNDYLAGGQGRDILRGGTGQDSLFGEEGDDQLIGDDGADSVEGGEGHDSIFGGAGADVLSGGPGDDVLRGDGHADRILCGAGDDVAYGAGGDDALFGDEGDDALIGGPGVDSAVGGAGTDACVGSECELPELVRSGCATDLDCEPTQRCITEVGLCLGCLADDDGDGICNSKDGCPSDPEKSELGLCGCAVPDLDPDGDAIPDCIDACSDDPSKAEPGLCGCGVSEQDQDDDGAPDCLDLCATDPGKTAPGSCGCGVTDQDQDADGAPDCVDACATDAGKILPGLCGCGVPDTNQDGDGAPDCHDACPVNAEKTEPGVCGCSESDIDSDEDGTIDCLDLCPDDPDGDCVEGALDICPDDAEQRCTGTIVAVFGARSSEALAISGDGKVVVGSARATDGTQAVRWTEAEGSEELGYGLSGINQRESRALTTSADGAVVAGWTATLDSALRPARLGFRWTREGGMALISPETTLVQGMSADASLLVGWGGRWTPSYMMAGAWDESLGRTGSGPFNLPWDASESMAASADGSLVLGTAVDFDARQRVAYLASRNLTFVRLLPDLPGSGSDWVTWFYPRDMSNDATVVVGESANASGNQPVRWSAASGTVALGRLGGASTGVAVATSADGSVVLGVSGTVPFLWTAARGMRALVDAARSLNPQAFGPLTNIVPTGISDDGRRIVGSGRDPTGITVGWLLQLGDDFAL